MRNARHQGREGGALRWSDYGTTTTTQSRGRGAARRGGREREPRRVVGENG